MNCLCQKKGGFWKWHFSSFLVHFTIRFLGSSGALSSQLGLIGNSLYPLLLLLKFLTSFLVFLMLLLLLLLLATSNGKIVSAYFRQKTTTNF